MNNYAEKLQKILSASGWSQEALANKLEVSFATLNSWVNNKSEPRDKAKIKIDLLATKILGNTSVDQDELRALKKSAERHTYSVRRLVSDRHLLDTLTVNLAYHSNGTEGSTMTLSDVEDVIIDNKVLKNRTAIEQREAINTKTALDFLLDKLSEKGKDFIWTPELIQHVHLRLMSGIISDAGLWRNHAVRISGSRTAVSNFIKIPELVNHLCAMANEESSDKIALLAHFHAKFEQIHPFSDGNGRAGRILLFALALQRGLVPPILPKERRYAYYSYLELAQSRELFDPLEQYLAECIIATADKME